MIDNILEKLVVFYIWISGKFKNHYFDRHHLVIRKDDGNWHIGLYNHENYIELTNINLQNLKKRFKPKNFIQKAINECNYCNFLIFQCIHPTLFIQFWLGDNQIQLNYPMNLNNQLGRFKYQILGVLAEMGFVRSYSKDKKLLPYYFKFVSMGKYNEIVANFGKDNKLASKFTCMVISEIFKEDLGKLETKIG